MVAPAADKIAAVKDRTVLARAPEAAGECGAQKT
jgi:hypothetical protein